jgi:polyisoprenoid-binding protein YceI
VNRKGIIGIAVALPVIVVAALVIGLLSYAHELPWQSQPTAIPVTPFANLSSPAPVGTTVSSVPTTSAPTTAAPTSAPAATAAIAPTTAAYATAVNTAAIPGTATAGAPVATATSPAASAPSGTTAATTGGAKFAIAADQSQAQVTVNEKFANLPAPSDAVLTTNAIQGQIVLGPDTKPTDASKIQVDLRTLKSDKTQRDNFIRQNTLQSDQFPLAEYTITGVEQWNGPLQNGQQATFKLVGQMTIHGVTKPVTFDTTATMNGDTLNGTAKTSFTFEDFGMTAPKVAIVTANDKIDLVMTIVAKKAA